MKSGLFTVQLKQWDTVALVLTSIMNEMELMHLDSCDAGVNILELPAMFDENIEKHSLEYHESMHICSMYQSTVFVIMNDT